ncbi:MAG: hypothetical protein QM817_01630 [Archangium sp.]
MDQTEQPLALPIPIVPFPEPRTGRSRAWWLHVARTLGMTIALIVGIAIFWGVVTSKYHPSQWLFFDYAKYWALTLVFFTACFLPGFVVTRWLLPQRIRLGERLVVAIALGVFLFYLGMYVGGLLHLYGLFFYIAYPALLITLGGVLAWKSLSAIVRRWWRIRRLPFRRMSPVELLAFGAGVFGLLMIYAQVMVPENDNYDSKWYHLPIAEHYVAAGGVEKFVEGWYQGALPHLSSFLYAWPMMQPPTAYVHRLLGCAHIEFILFVATLLSIPVLVRFLVPTSRPSLSWVTLFVFPGVFLYDSSLGIAADHIAALWAVPLFIALARFLKDMNLRWGIVLGLLLAAAISTKYQAASLVVFPILAVVVRAAWLVLRNRELRKQAVLGSLLAGGVMVLFFAPHWLKNWLWYGDPAYPWMHKYFHAKMWTPDTAGRLETIYANHLWTPKGDTTLDKLIATIKAVFTFSFVPNDWESFHHDWPVIGSLFTLLGLLLPMVRKSGWLWALFACANVGVFAWFWQSHQDRYLQALIPWMAGFTAAMLIIAWRQALLVKIAVVVLIALQVVWSGDSPFFNAHRQTNGVHPYKLFVDRMSSGFERRFESRTAMATWTMAALGDILPPDARVLTHEEEQHIGVMRPVVNDWSEWQGGLSYGRFKSPAEVYDRLKEYGITHIVQTPDRSRDSDALPGDIVYYDFVTHFAPVWKTVNIWRVMEMPKQRPTDAPFKPVLWMGCDSLYDQGLYDLPMMMTPFWGKRAKTDVPKPLEAANRNDVASLEVLLAKAGSYASDPRCAPIAPPSLTREFVRVTTRGPLAVWVRRR